MSKEIILKNGRHYGTKVFIDGGNVLCRHQNDDRDLIVYVGVAADIELKSGGDYIYITHPKSNYATAIDTEDWSTDLVDMSLPPETRHIRGVL
jgi:hypothetical protein